MGQLEDGRSFDFRLKREVGSVIELSDSMRKAERDFENSLSNTPTTHSFTTEFRYPLRDDAREVVEEGIATLKQCAPFVVAFNQQFSKINIQTSDGTVEFEVVERTLLDEDRIEQVTVSETENETQSVRQYILVSGDRSSVTFPMELDSEGQQVCLPVDDIPKLFLGFPLVGTENFSFPAIINSFKFTPTVNRDGVYLWRADDTANQENQAVLEEASELLVELIQFAASSGWHNAYHLAEIPDVQAQSWLDETRLRTSLAGTLIQRIRKTPAVLNESGEAILPGEAKLPLANTPEGVLHLWDLLVGWQEDSDIWPRRDEAVGWCNAIRSWARVSEHDVSSFEEVIDGRKLASIVDDVSHDKSADPRTHRLSLLKNSLKENVSPIDWLDRLIGFLMTNGLGEVIREQRIVPSQRGFLRALPNLRRDDGIDEGLKDIAELLDWQLREEIRDTRLTSLSDETGSEGWGNDKVAEELIKRLRECANNNPDDAFAKASTQLFTWIVKSERWELLADFPVFARRMETARPRIVLYLRRSDQANDRPMAPVSAWSEDLQPFADLFPPARIMSDDFFEAVPAIDTWQMIAHRDLARTEVIISDAVRFNKFYPDYPLSEGPQHQTVELVPVTDLWNRTGLMERVRDSQERAGLFWQFITDWLLKRDLQSLEIVESECECEETHRYYPAAWIEPIRESSWIRLPNDRRDQANAQSLANLLRGSGHWNPNSLSDNSATSKFLGVIGVSRLALMQEFGCEG